MLVTVATKRQERAEATERLRAMLNPGDTVYTVLRHVSRSGMMRHIDLYLLGNGEPQWITGLAARAMDWTTSPDGYLKVQGAGMDIGFHAVYTLSHTLWPDGHPCAGSSDHWSRGCPSNDHTNERYGESSYAPGRIHSDGGYALRHRWL